MGAVSRREVKDAAAVAVARFLELTFGRLQTIFPRLQTISGRLQTTSGRMKASDPGKKAGRLGFAPDGWDTTSHA